MARIVNRGSRVLSGVVRGPRRATEWLASADVASSTALAGAASVLNQSFTAAQIGALGPLTVVRTRGLLMVSSDETTQSEEPFGALGFMVVREQARAAGITAIPTPITEEFDDGFFVHQFFHAGIRVATGTQAGQIAAPGWSTYEFDSRAMRKVNADDAIVVTLENANASHGLLFVLKFRMLVKLH